MKTFRFFPPTPEEQRFFTVQLFGTILTVFVVIYLFTRTYDLTLRGALIGIVIGALFLLTRSAVQLETKSQRAQNAEIVVEKDGFKTTDAQGNTETVGWDQIESSEVSSGRLLVKWPGGELRFGAREVENGMELIRLIVARGKSTSSQSTSGDGGGSNFIPLDPK